MTGPQTPLPPAKEVRDLLADLLGREVEVRTGAAMVDPTQDGGALVGVYVDRLLSLRALCLMDLPAAAYVGAAIGLVPARVAQESVECELLGPGLEENAREVLNVLASLLNAEGAPHVRLDAVHAPREALPHDVAPWVRAYVRRTDLEIDVVGYGRGGFSLLVL
ncbi:hypothetical protein J1G44_10370 [Cellulomonas sp. zg-ZUI199]|uniref:Uncharacterized protein n=1 Tax=Cellulomonas wangleii TaxID=2816956 RepID=A0ABX8D6I3_9CELL|nr:MULTISPECIES: hypothetical protein [Cellulomonas]MBO0901246.1 hypothetical protein [Cellulomonas sp. zg-ZUI22]MBO0924886.1 hypothetical protein [Cellulomonas wangleii]QVI63051.1 hypothetical protein KG103_03775 [Cellulomonas wangleii]